jgi:hypothetical protein
MKNFDLNIDKILENWEVFHAVWELLIQSGRSISETYSPDKKDQASLASEGKEQR